MGEIENTLMTHAAVKDAIVLAKASATGDKRLVAYVVTDAIDWQDESAVAITASHEWIESLRHHLSEILPDYMVPSAFVLLEKLPLTPNGKVDRKALPEPDISLQQNTYVAPRTKTEKILCEIWQTALGIAQVGITDNFFQLGGHSLLIVQIISRLQQHGLSMPARQLFTTPSLGELARALDADSKSTLPLFKAPANLIPEGCELITPDMLPLVNLSAEELSSIVEKIPGGAANVQDIYPLAPLQEGILFHHITGEQSDPYVLPCLFKIKSHQAVTEFINALQFVVNRHDVLRTAILWDRLSVPVQVVCRKVTLSVTWLELDSINSIEEKMRARCAPEHQWMDLTQPNLIKLEVAEDSLTGQYFVFLQYHHITSDHVGFGIIEKEIISYQMGQADKLPASIPYREFVAHAQHQALHHDAEAFFTQMLSDVEESTAPFNLLDINGDGSHILDAKAAVPAATSSALRRLAKDLTISPAAIFHTAWAMVVGACSSRNDVVFGTVLSGRLQGTLGAEHMLGVVINTLPLRVKLNDKSVLAVVKEVQNSLLDLLPFEQASLALAQRCSGVQGGAPLFTALLNYRHSVKMETDQSNVEESSIFKYIAGQERANYPFGLSVDDFGGDFALNMQVKNTINVERIVGYMQTAIAELVCALQSSPHQAINKISVLPQVELQQLLTGWNNTQEIYPKDKCIHELFEAHVESNPNATAVVFENQKITYGELNLKANQLAHYLINKKQVTPDTLVGICVNRSLDMVIGMLAILKAGGAYVPIDPEYPETRLKFMLDDAKLVTVLTQNHLRDTTPVTDEQAVCLDSNVIKQELQAQPSSNLNAQVLGLSSRHLAYVIYTSGTTGNPKGVLIEHRSLVNLVVSDQKLFGLTPASKFLNPLSIGFDAGNGYLWDTLGAGASLYLESPTNDLFNTIETESITHAVMAAAILKAQDVRATDHLKVLISGGDLCDSQLLSSLSRETKFFNVYGPTENTVTSTCQEMVINQKNSIGKPITNVICLVLSPDNLCVPIECAGELYIGGVGLARGYLNCHDLTAEKFISNPFYDNSQPGSSERLYKTGDLVRWLANGNLEFMGRIDHQVKIRGFRIELGEIESALSLHEHVEDVAVLAKESVNGDKRLVAYVATGAVALADERGITIAARDSLLENFRNFLVKTLPAYMVPSTFVLLAHLPLTPNGKVDRKALPEPDMSTQLTAYVAPRNQTEKTLCEIWQGLLGIKRVGITDDFFELGGDSLRAVRFVGTANKAGLGYSVVDVMKYPTVEALVKISDDKNKLPISQALVVGEVPLSTAQQLFLNTTLDQPNWGNAVRYFDFEYLDKLLLEESLLRVVTHHDALRAKFIKTSDGWRQILIEPSKLNLSIDYIDYSNIPDEDKVEKIDRFLFLNQGEMNLLDAPLIKVKVFYLGSQKGYVGRVNIHHLLVDGYSANIFFEDWIDCYSNMIVGKPFSFPNKTTSTFEWVNRLIQEANSTALEKEIEYWFNLPWDQAIDLPVDYSSKIHENNVGSNRDIHLSLSIDHTSALLNLGALIGVPFVNILIVALVETLADYAQSEWIPIRVLDAGRGFDLGLDASRTIGWFCVQRTLLLQASKGAKTIDALKNINEQIEKIPNKGFGLELLQCYHNNKVLKQDLESLIKTEVFFNFQGVTEYSTGQSEAPFSTLLDKGAYVGHWISPVNINNEKFTCNAGVVNGKLSITWRYSENLYCKTNMDLLTRNLLDKLAAMSECIQFHKETDKEGGLTERPVSS
ncbi:MAG: amino acid adenylation domain-containing protein [Pseudomonadota bacterium]